MLTGVSGPTHGRPMGTESPTSTCKSVVIRFYNNLQDRGGLPKYAETLQDSGHCGLDCGLELTSIVLLGWENLFFDFTGNESR